MIPSVSNHTEVSFQLVASGIVDTAFNRVQVQGKVTFDIAASINPEIASKHYALYPYFKDAVGNVDAPTAYEYLLVRLPNNTLEAVGIPWILESSFTVVGDQTATITITGYQDKYSAPLKDLLGNLGATYVMDVK